MPAALLRVLTVAAFLWAAPFLAAETVTVRVIDIGNQHPLPKQPVTVALYYSHMAPPFNEEATFTTDAQGEVHVPLPEPMPEYMTVQIIPDYSKWTCSCVAIFETKQLLQTGIVEAAAENKDRVPVITAKPGEVTFAVRQTSRWLRPFHFLYRD